MDDNYSPTEAKAPQPAAIIPPTPSVATSVSDPWEAFVTGKSQSAEKFLKTIEKEAIVLPDEATRTRFAETIAAKPKKIARLISLLQASTSARETLRRIATQLAESTIRKLGLIAIPESMDREEYSGAINSWLASIPKKPLAGPRLNELWLLLHFGSLRQLLDTESAYKFVRAATISPPRKAKIQPEAATPDSLEVLLAASPSRPVLAPLVCQFAAGKKLIDRLRDDLATQAAEISRLGQEIRDLNDSLNALRDRLTSAAHQKDADDSRIRDLEEQIVDIQDGYQHKVDALRARIRGFLDGQLTRWLQTALDASRADPPFLKAIDERLEDALKLIQREAECLQPSV